MAMVHHNVPVWDACHSQAGLSCLCTGISEPVGSKHHHKLFPQPDADCHVPGTRASQQYIPTQAPRLPEEGSTVVQQDWSGSFSQPARNEPHTRKRSEVRGRKQEPIPEPKPRSPFRAFRNQQAVQQGYRDASSCPVLSMEVDGDEGAGPSDQAVPDDADIARLMEMGYDPQVAAQVGIASPCLWLHVPTVSTTSALPCSF